MDPAIGVSSPFHDVVNGKDGVYDNAISSITASKDYNPTGLVNGVTLDPSSFRSIAQPPSYRDAGEFLPTTMCTLCNKNATTAKVPEDGIYVCKECFSASKQKERPPRTYPTMTFKCCPMSTTDKNEGVVRCAGCKGWYHQSCTGITDPRLKAYIELSTTVWYCPEPSCAEKQLLDLVNSRK